MEMTAKRQAAIDAHLAETRRLMTDFAFELNDLVRFAISASKVKPQKVYYPMDPVHESIRQWNELSRKAAKLADQIAHTRERLGVAPFDAEQPSEADDAAPDR